METLANQAEVATSKGEQGKVYKITEIVCGKYRGTTDTPITYEQGRLLTTEAEPEARWSKHFREVLNRPPSMTQADIQETAEADLDIHI